MSTLRLSYSRQAKVEYPSWWIEILPSFSPDNRFTIGSIRSDISATWIVFKHLGIRQYLSPRWNWWNGMGPTLFSWSKTIGPELSFHYFNPCDRNIFKSHFRHIISFSRLYISCAQDNINLSRTREIFKSPACEILVKIGKWLCVESTSPIPVKNIAWSLIYIEDLYWVFISYCIDETNL